MLRRIFAVLLVLAAILSCAFADDSVEPCADVTFLSATCSLGMDKVATFTLMTDILAGRIVVTNAWLEQQSNGRWVYVMTRWLFRRQSPRTPSRTSAEPSLIPARLRPEAPFRIGFTADADGHQITRYSNSRRFIRQLFPDSPHFFRAGIRSLPFCVALHATPVYRQNGISRRILYLKLQTLPASNCAAGFFDCLSTIHAGKTM